MVVLNFPALPIHNHQNKLALDHEQVLEQDIPAHFPQLHN